MPSRTRPAAQCPTMPVRVGARRRRGRPDVVGQARREVVDVVALVAVLGHRLAAPERRDRRAEVPDLAARVVEVVLARDALAAGLEDAAEQVADERAAGVADVERPGRVGRHELDVDRSRGSPARRRPQRGGSARIARDHPSRGRRRARRRLRKPGGATSRAAIGVAPDRPRPRARAPPRAPWRSRAAPSGTAGRASSRGCVARSPCSGFGRALDLDRDRRAVGRQGGQRAGGDGRLPGAPDLGPGRARIEDDRGSRRCGRSRREW